MGLGLNHWFSEVLALTLTVHLFLSHLTLKVSQITFSQKNFVFSF